MQQPNEQTTQASLFAPIFDDQFLERHARAVITNPEVAVIELVANAWDAGATRVTINWNADQRGLFEIQDNGTGMTRSEFSERWMKLYYNRVQNQGSIVEFPPDTKLVGRRAYGRNGIGRHAAFHFGTTYQVETIRSGHSLHCTVSRAYGGFQANEIDYLETDPSAHGTRIWASMAIPPLSAQQVLELLGTKFISDPSFSIWVNGESVGHLASQLLSEDQHIIDVPGVGPIYVSLIDTHSRSRTTLQNGVAWWVNRRLVGRSSWDKLDGTPYTDGRSTRARRYTFIVQADMLIDEVEEDWSRFKKDSTVVPSIASPVEEHIESRISDMLNDIRQERKLDALRHSKDTLKSLTIVSANQVSEFADKLQAAAPTLRPEHLNDAVAVLATLEQARSGFSLLSRLAQLKPDEMDMLDSILEKWTVSQINIVLEEIERRLRFIESLESIVDDKSTDELHDLQPLFERGLWVFGPEYEGIGFTSNRQIATVVRELLGDHELSPTRPRLRPDFVAVPNASIGLYSHDGYGLDHETDEVDKLLIVELKRGGFKITPNEINQAQGYIHAIRESGKVGLHAEITAYVVGSERDSYVSSESPFKSGRNDQTRVIGTTYASIIRRAHNRTFLLAEKLRNAKSIPLPDRDVVAVLQEEEIDQQFSLDL